MANPEHLAKIRKAVAAWNAWREANPKVNPDLRGARLMPNGALLRGVNLIRANLSQALLSGAYLMRANLIGADLSGANLRGALFSGANLSAALLGGANLSAALLGGANLSGADLSGANVEKASVSETVFGDVDLSEVKGLETIEHRGPSTIGVDTLYRSNGKIPEVFLKGCGLRDWEIESAKLYHRGLGAAEINDIVYRVYELRAGQPLQYHSCFISHATEDQTFANRVYDDLQARGVRCWFAPHDMRPGRKIHKQISDAIQFHDKLLLVLSPSSIASNWVRFEIARAHKREVREKRQLLFPLGLLPFEALENWECFDADTATDLAAEIRSYFIPDFSKWGVDNEAYKQAFERLVSSLAASKKNAAAPSDAS